MSTPRMIIHLAIIYIAWLSQSSADESGFRICFQETEGSSQCEGPSYTCSGWSSNPAWSEEFRDDTDDRSGGCEYQWRIESRGSIDPNLHYRLCFKETEGSSQCQGTRSSCTGWSLNPSWTSTFRDDTDDRSGGCKYAWRIESQDPTEPVCRVCFKETEGSSQCQKNRQSCSGWSSSGDPSWTLPFRDDTDDRSGGCKYQWFFDCVPEADSASCQEDSPCQG